MHPNAALIHVFYRAMQAGDAEAMAACYAADVHFSDPVFEALQGDQAADMWRMLLSRAKDFQVAFDDVEANDCSGSAQWVARYTFSQTGRPVVNRIRASFEFADGKIVRHADRFDLWRWAAQALGLKGLLLGWSAPVRQAIRRQAAAGLAAFRARAGR
ncbi:MAG TPA: nuclear transport factor 2 family protein [Herbaspirillum sp.]|jgi:ketosteroid isomerase-like protein